ncbi:MAG: ATP:cob(I)alamin adenosyltransferase [Nanoarchaeota archaeon]|nr:ATP:cob(I)alamin adenosyltransferase [Nanoarchaeota archaeon]
MKAYTKRGDLGYTHDYSGKKIPKDNMRIVCWGKVDELQAAVDGAILQARGKNRQMLEEVQTKLWQISGEIACSPPECVNDPVTEADLKMMERFIDTMGEPPQKFIRFTNTEAIVLNESRVRCRNLERNLVKLLRNKTLRPVIFKYVNRLSSLFFMLAYERVKKRTKVQKKQK